MFVIVRIRHQPKNYSSISMLIKHIFSFFLISILTSCGGNLNNGMSPQVNKSSHYQIYDAKLTDSEYTNISNEVKSIFDDVLVDKNGNRYLFSKNDSSKVLLLFPGLAGTESDYFSPVGSLLIKYFIEKNFRVVVTNNELWDSKDYSILFSNNGKDYRTSYFPEKLNQKISFISGQKKLDTIVFAGISFGGFHAMVAACIYPSNSIYIAIQPSVSPEFLFTDIEAATYNNLPAVTPNSWKQLPNGKYSSLPTNGDTQDLLWTNECRNNLGKSTGFVLYGGQDTRVNGPLTEQLINSINLIKDIYLVEVIDGTHTDTSYQINLVLNLINLYASL